MNHRDLLERAKEKSALDKAQKAQPFYVHTMAWFHYLGLLRHNQILPRRFTVTLEEAVKAGQLEPRVLELLPAILVVLPKALKFRKDDIPEDLAMVVERIRKRMPNEDFRGIPSHSYLRWLQAPVMDVAKRRVDFHRVPRRRPHKTHAIGEIIRSARLSLSLTQKELATKHKLSLRVIRDLEQGKLDASLKATIAILKVFGRSLSAL